jgi:hypothetical protein
MIIGITGTLGAGKGEGWVGNHPARGCRYFRIYEKVSYNLNSDCKSPAPVFTPNTNNSLIA